MLPANLRFDARHYPRFFVVARNWRVNGLLAKVAPALEGRETVRSSETTKNLPQPSVPHSPLIRWSVVVAKRHGNAVQRAKIKRQLRHAILSLWQQEPALFALPYVVVLVVNQPTGHWHEYLTALRQLLVKLHASDRQSNHKTQKNDCLGVTPYKLVRQPTSLE